MEESSTSQPILSQSLASVDTELCNFDTKAIDHEKKISQLEHDIFLISKQLDETKDALKEASSQNVVLKDRVTSLESEKVEHNQFVQNLEKVRNELIDERKRLYDAKIHLQTQKDFFENECTKVTNEKRRLAEELASSKTDCAKLRDDKLHLQIQVDEFASEKNLIAYDKERWAREKEILVQGKQWCMNEISARETKLSEMRIDMMKLEAKVNREKFALTKEKDALAIKVDELTEMLEKRDQECVEHRTRLQKIVDERATTLNEMDAELRAKERLADLFKASFEAAQTEVESLKERESKLQAVIQESEMAVVNINTEMEKLAAEKEKELAAKEAAIVSLTEELGRANELLKIGGGRMYTTTDEISSLSPATAAASNLVKSGLSLSSIYVEHCRVVSELQKKSEENERIERYVNELIEELDSKAPLFREQREFYEKSLEEINRLRLQNNLLSDDRQKLQIARDSISRELLFTRAELERYQQEHQALTLQVRRLLFSIERSNNGNDTEESTHENDEYLFTNIQELHQRNIELLTRVKNLEVEKQEAIQSHQVAATKSLRNSLDSAQKELENLCEVHAKTELVVSELTAQRDNYKRLYEEGAENLVSPPGSGVGSVNNASAADKGDAQHWKARVDFLQEKLEYFSSDKMESDRAFNERIDQQLEQIAQLRTTNGKLESALEFQKKNQQLMTKSTDELNKELKKSEEGLSKLKVRCETLQARNDDFTNQLLNQQQELSQLKVLKYSLEEQLQVARANEQRTAMELGVLRETKFNSEKMALTLQEIETVLKRTDVEKETSFASQLQSACIERDNLKVMVETMTRQHTEMTNNLKFNLNELTGERDCLSLDLKALRETNSMLENRFKILKEEYEKLTSESINPQVADDNIDACKKEIQQFKNKCAYQEKQVSELQAKVDELEKSVEFKEAELVKICSLSGNMENVIREQTEYGEMERKRLQLKCDQYENDLKTSKSQIEELRNQVANLELSVLEKERAVEHAQSQLQEMEAQYQAKCVELEAAQSTHKEVYEQLQTVVDNLQLEYSNHKADYATLSSDKDQLEKQLAEEKSKVDRLHTTINDLNIEVAKARNTVELLEKEKLSQQDELAACGQRDNEHLERTKTLYDEIQKLVGQVSYMEQLQLQHQSEGAGVSSSLGSGIQNYALDNPQQADRINTIIGYMRQEKQKETELRMNAELELQRLRAQNSIDHKRIGELQAELSQARIVAESNSRAARENERMLSELDAFRVAQQRNVQLKKDFDELNQKFVDVTKKANELTTSFSQAQKEKNALERQLTAANQNLEARKKDILNLRQRNEQALALAAKYSPENYSSLLGQFEQQKQQLTQKDKELELLKSQLSNCTTEITTLKLEIEEKNSVLSKTNFMLSQAKTLARNFRDSSNQHERNLAQLKEELDKCKADLATAISTRPAEASASADDASSWSNTRAATAGQQTAKLLLQEKIAEIQRIKAENESLLAKINALEKEKTDLTQAMDEMTKKLADAEEKCIRMDTITSMLNNSRTRVNNLADELEAKKREIEELKRSASSQSHMFQTMSRKRQLEVTTTSTSDSLIPAGGNVALTEKRSKLQESDSGYGDVGCALPTATSSFTVQVPTATVGSTQPVHEAPADVLVGEEKSDEHMLLDTGDDMALSSQSADSIGDGPRLDLDQRDDEIISAIPATSQDDLGMLRDANLSSVNQPFQITDANVVSTTASEFYDSSNIPTQSILAAATSAPPTGGSSANEHHLDYQQSSDVAPQLYNVNDDDVEEEIIEEDEEQFAAEEPFEMGEEEEEVDADEYDEEEEFGEEIPENSDDEGNDGPIEETEENADSSGDIICLSDDEEVSAPPPSQPATVAVAAEQQQLLEESRPSPQVLNQNVENEDDE